MGKVTTKIDGNQPITFKRLTNLVINTVKPDLFKRPYHPDAAGKCEKLVAHNTNGPRTAL